MNRLRFTAHIDSIIELFNRRLLMPPSPPPPAADAVNERLRTFRNDHWESSNQFLKGPFDSIEVLNSKYYF
ncbi:hypothetical protein RB195_006510 [Necator americanus]|uniref:Uncharacterized protein n=1 Tax=Necator americanus TaxID=51031 RepID=A0ABR1BSZ0_NECAM